MSLADVLRKHFFFDPVSQIEEKPFNLVDYFNTMSTEEILQPPTPDHVYRVSSLVKLCAREEVLKFKHKVVKKQKINAKLRRTFDFGENYHRMIQNEILGPRGILLGDWICKGCRQEVINKTYPSECHKCLGKSFEYRELTPSNTRHGISAHVDGVLSVGGQKKVLELKTVNAISFRLITEVNKEANEAHRKQINLYMWLTGIHQGIILYFDKNESQLFQWEEKLNHSYIKKVLGDLGVAREGMRTGLVPTHKVCETATCARAKACPVSKLCFSDE